MNIFQYILWKHTWFLFSSDDYELAQKMDCISMSTNGKLYAIFLLDMGL